VIYSPTPSKKTFIFDSEEQLSGGEKTIANLSLFLAINLALKAPLVVLDETDAYLDKFNTRQLVATLNTLSKTLQILLITHKSEIFDKTESLIGVTISLSELSSVAFALDLSV